MAAQDAGNWQFTVGTALLMGDYALAEDIIQTAKTLNVSTNTIGMLRRMVTRSKGLK